jgi:hypothetical protein
MRVSIFLLESKIVLSEDVVILAVKIDPVSNVLELVLDSIKSVTLLNEVFHRRGRAAKCFQRGREPAPSLVSPLFHCIRHNPFKLHYALFW